LTDEPHHTKTNDIVIHANKLKRQKTFFINNAKYKVQIRLIHLSIYYSIYAAHKIAIVAKILVKYF